MDRERGVEYVGDWEVLAWRSDEARHTEWQTVVFGTHGFMTGEGCCHVGILATECDWDRGHFL